MSCGGGGSNAELRPKATFFGDRYTPTLTTAPQVMANFLRFLIARNVLPQHTAKVKAAIPMCDQAKLQCELPLSISLSVR